MSAGGARFEARAVGLVRDYVYDQLLDAIVSGRIQPGEWIRERQVAAELGVSTTPVKEAVRRLDNEGLVVSEPRRGAYVSQAVRTSIEEVLTIRATLEALAARWAATKLDRGDRRLPLDDVAAQLRAFDWDGAGWQERLAELNTSFHERVREVGGNLFIGRFVRVLLGLDASVRRRALQFPEEARRGWEEHLALYDAIVARDAERAAGIAEEHVLRSYRFVRERMDAEAAG